ncbi:hypothetical protein [Mucilaginibacter flavidus]|uniref:hypothetical protein n=1 Tax=Mucilaginibacter flavidus TaxID=2949309 RepID=UPI002092E420|nr:hypothetical protein [Mucilaginibacter flavidus]MCO5948172.1 hypothetical protein [Mucilaginibacter flavidus]
MEKMIEQISQLNRSEVIEAALSVSAIVAGDVAEETDNNDAELYLAHMDEIEEFARVILINTAEQSVEYRDMVSKIIKTSGKKNVVLTPELIVSLAGIGVIALHILFKKPLSEDIKYTDSTGKKIEIKRKYSNDTSLLATLMRKIIR